LIIGSDFLIAQGDTVDLDAAVEQPDGVRQAVSAQWTSSNAQVITIIPGLNRAVAAAPGTATLSASLGTIGAQAVAVVVDKQLGKVNPTPGDALVVDRFFTIEYLCPGSDDQWCYAPQIRASAAPGRMARITTLTFLLPGVLGAPPTDCNAQLVTTALRELNGDAYGDWLFYIDANRQAIGATAGVSITFVDDAGRTTTRVLDGPIVRGGLPWSTSGVGSSGACYPYDGSMAPSHR
jgi:hypothetical protein